MLSILASSWETLVFNSVLFTGTLRHRRFTPSPHQFTYRLFMFCLDINTIAHSLQHIKYASFEKFNWFSFRRKNYLSQPDVALDDYARQVVQQKLNLYPQGKIFLLTQLSCLGYCFNPISIYFIFDKANQYLEYLLLEVTNTPWGEKHNYVLQSMEKSKNSVYHYEFEKELHVSPFMAMNYKYQVTIKLTEQKIIVQMENHKNGNKDFDATLTLDAVPKKGNSFKAIFIRFPLITYKVSAAIYWQALKLWLKKVPVYFHPNTGKRK